MRSSFLHDSTTVEKFSTVRDIFPQRLRLFERSNLASIVRSDVVIRVKWRTSHVDPTVGSEAGPVPSLNSLAASSTVAIDRSSVEQTFASLVTKASLLGANPPLRR